MKKLVLLLIAFLMLGLGSNVFAQISWSGDLQVRPRYDMKNYGDYGGKTNDLYYMMRAGINLKASLGEGFFGKIRLEHYNYAGYIYTAGSGMDGTAFAPRIPGSNDIIARPSVNFTQLYFGVNKKNWGIQAGIVPVSGLKNPIMDIHYMPMKMIDIPFTLYRLNTLVGVSGYVAAGESNKFEYFISNDQNEYYEEDINGNAVHDKHDVYTVGADFSFNVNDFWIQPIAMLTWASDSVSAPVSYGINLATPEFSGFKFEFDGALSKQSKDGTAKYDAQLFRFKVNAKAGSGSFEAWFDLAKRTDKFSSGDVDHNYTYLWLLYKIPVFSSDHGALTIIPRVRHMTEKVDNAYDFSRNKIEMLFVMSFK